MFICSAAAAIHVRIAIASPPSSALRVSGFQNAAACNGVHQPAAAGQALTNFAERLGQKVLSAFRSI